MYINYVKKGEQYETEIAEELIISKIDYKEVI